MIGGRKALSFHPERRTSSCTRMAHALNSRWSRPPMMTASPGQQA